MITMKKYVNFQLVIMVVIMASFWLQSGQVAEAKTAQMNAPETKDAARIVSPEGEWQVEDKTAHIRVASCDGTFWGVISWEKQPGIDEFNPDASKKKLPMQALPILHAMKAENDGGWHGEIYNADNGKIYMGSIRLVAKDILKITGCLFEGYLCGSERWQRAKATFSSKVSAMDDKTLCAVIKKRMQ